MKQIQQVESKEDLGALLEGDLVNTKQGLMVYTEKFGSPRLIRQFNAYRILSARVDGKNGDVIVFDSQIKKLKIERGIFVDIFSNNVEYGWVQYDCDQSILAENSLKVYAA